MHDVNAHDEQLSVLDLLLLIAKNARLLVLGPLLVGLAAFAVAFVIPPTFTATTRILPPQQRQNSVAMLASQLGSLSGLAGAVGLSLKNPADTYVALIKSRTVADHLIARFNLLKVYDEKYLEEGRKELEKSTTVKTGKDGLITIEVDDENPKRAADLANAYVDELYKLTASLAITEAQERRVFFEKQLKQTHDNLRNAELALSQTGAGENLIKSAPQALVETIARLRAQVTAQEIRISTMRSFLTESSPEFQLAQRQLTSLRDQLSQAERDQPIKGDTNQNYLNRFREFKYQETLFELMAKQYELARLDEAREGTVIQVVDVALPPERKSKPKRVLIASISALLAVLILLLYVFIKEYLNAAGAETLDKLTRIVSMLRAHIRRR